MGEGKKRCRICAYYENCRNEDTECQNGEYFYPEDKNRSRIPSEASRNSSLRFFYSKKYYLAKRTTSIDRFLDNLELERQFF